MITQTVSCVDLFELQRMKPLKGVEHRGKLMKHDPIVLDQIRMLRDISEYVHMIHAKSESNVHQQTSTSQRYPSLPTKLDMVELKIDEKATDFVPFGNDALSVSEDVQKDDKVPRGLFKRICVQLRKLICI